MTISGVIFDLDGTLTVPNLDFDLLREKIGIGPEPVLEYIEGLEGEAAGRAWRILEDWEMQGAREASLADGVHECMDYMEAEGIRTAVLTRNSRQSAHAVLGRFGLAFDAIVAREDAAPKPSPEPVLLLSRQLGTAVGDLVMVGDYLFDIQAGNLAGARTALVVHGEVPDYALQADYVISSLRELIPILEGLNGG